MKETNAKSETMIKGMTYKQWIEQETKSRKVEFWGQTFEFEPYLCDTILGDGMQLVYLCSMNSRPHYWLIRIDSKTDISDYDFNFEDILIPIEEECGACGDDGCEICEENGKECQYPAISWGGGTWGVVINFNQKP